MKFLDRSRFRHTLESFYDFQEQDLWNNSLDRKDNKPPHLEECSEIDR